MQAIDPNNPDGVTLRERVGISVNTTNLAPECAASTVVAALGSCTMMRSGVMGPAGARMRENAVGAPVIDIRRRIAALLQRAKHGGDHSTLNVAAILFARWMRGQPRYAAWKIRGADALIVRFAAAVVTEWMHDNCARCGGQGRVLAGEPGRNARTRGCPICQGRGRVMPRPRERMRMLGVDAPAYDRHWTERFASAHAWLAAIERSNLGALQTQLKRGNVPASITR